MIIRLIGLLSRHHKTRSSSIIQKHFLNRFNMTAPQSSDFEDQTA